jgi:hypothetical protein
MVHQGESLALGLEAGDDCPSVHAELDELEGDAPTHGFLLLREIDNSAAAFTDLLEQFVPANQVAGFFQLNPLGKSIDRRIWQKRLGGLVGVEQRFDSLAQFCILAASGVKVIEQVDSWRQFESLLENFPGAFGRRVHFGGNESAEAGF